MNQLELDQGEYEAIRQRFDVERSYKRVKVVLWSSFLVAALGLAVVLLGDHEVALLTLAIVFMVYVALAGLERISYMRAILGYKSALRKLTEQFDSEHDDRSLRREAESKTSV